MAGSSRSSRLLKLQPRWAANPAAGSLARLAFSAGRSAAARARAARGLLGVVVALAVMSAGLGVSTAAAQQDAPYPDVPADAYYAVPVRTLAQDGVFAGTLCDDGFCPGVPIDRKTMAVWTVRVLDGNDPPAVSETRFDDVDADGFHAPFIERMAELGVTRGCGDGSGFCPDQNVTRAQMAVFLSRAYNLPDGPDPVFADVPGDAWYAADVAKLAASGITVGCRDGTVFCPSRDTTRGQMATFLHRAENLGEPAESGSTPNPAMDGGGVISAGAGHSCRLTIDQTITCWGANAHGQSDPPAGTFSAVTAGAYHSCAIRTDRTIACWGANRHTDFGSGGGECCQSDPPAGTFSAVTAGASHSCAIRTDRTIACWGSHSRRGIYPPAGTFSAVTAGHSHSCGLRTDNTITCWGRNKYGQADAPSAAFTAVSAGMNHSCVIRADQTIACWGRNEHGQTDPPAGSFAAVTAGSEHSCAIRAGQTIACWGRNEHGQTDPPAGTFNAVTAGAYHSCAIRADQNVTCWGLLTEHGGTTAPTPASEYIKSQIIDRYSAEHPWLTDVWNYTNRPTFSYRWPRSTSDSSEATGSYHDGGSDGTLRLEYRFAYAYIFDPDTDNQEHLKSLLSIYLNADRVVEDILPLAAARLYYLTLYASNDDNELYNPDVEEYTYGRWSFRCKASSLFNSVAHYVVLSESISPQMRETRDACGLPPMPSDQEILSVEDALAGRTPRWFYDTFADRSGQWDYAAIWRCLVFLCFEKKTGYRKRHTGTIPFQMRNAFGGYCSADHIKSVRRPFLEADDHQPWHDGGCTDEIEPEGFITAYNRVSHAAKRIADQYGAEHPWLRLLWKFTNNVSFEYWQQAGPVVGDISCINCAYGGISPDGNGSYRASGYIAVGIYDPDSTFFDDTMVHEMFHIFDGFAPRDYPNHGPSDYFAPLAAAFLYFDELVASSSLPDRCDSTTEMIADAVDAFVVGPNYGIGGCVDPADPVVGGEVVAVVADALAGRMPQWFFDRFRDPNGGLDYAEIWSAVLASQRRGTVFWQLADSFGGYCSLEEAKQAVVGDVDLEQPWVDGGCSDNS